MHHTTLRRGIAALTLSAAALLPLPLTAQTEREITAPTGSIWLSGADTNAINGWINQGWRIVELDVDGTSPYAFTVSMVPNSGAYAVPGWWWYYGATAAQMNGFLTQNNARMIDIETYTVSGTRLYAGVMVSNTGSNFKESYVFYGSSQAAISSHLGSLNTRIVDLEGYDSGGTRLYAAVTIKNTGSDARVWWWYLGVTPAQISTALSQNQARLIDLERGSGGTYDCVMVRLAGEYWWYYYGLTGSGLTALLQQNGARPIDIERYSTLLGTRYDVVMLNSSNALTTRIGEILRNGTDGSTGAFLRRVGSSTSVLAALNSATPFEPASTMKTLHHVHAMRRVSQGLNSLGSNVTTFLGKNGSCPIGGAPSQVETLEQALRLMMENSDNCRTRTVELLFGRANVLATAGALGMTDTQINHTLGCGTPPNQITLEDFGRLHHAVAGGYVGGQRDTLYELMINSRTYPNPNGTTIDSIITSEAASLSLASAIVAAFKSQTVYAAKGGNYDFPSVPQYHGSYFGFLGLPACVNGSVQMREYAVGTYFNDATDQQNGFSAIGRAYVEIVREEIKAALQTWVGTALGSFAYYGTACAGTAGTPLLTATGIPEIHKQVGYSVSGAAASRPALLSIGLSRTSWNRVQLPLDLGVVGAPGCLMLTDPTITLSFTTSALGTGGVSFTLPNNSALIGGVYFSQIFVVDPRANTLGLVSTRGAETLVGKNL